jgi:hypothetical protein
VRGSKDTLQRTQDGQGTVLKVANIKGNEWMLPIELYSINRGLAFGEMKDDTGNTYSGYLNADGLREGAGVTILTTG